MYPTHSVKLRPEDVLTMSPKDVLWTSPYAPLCNAKGRPVLSSLGSWNVTSWGRLSVTSWGRLHTVLYVTAWDVPYRRLEDVSCRRYEGIPIRSNIYLQGTCPTDVPQRRPEDVLKTSVMVLWVRLKNLQEIRTSVFGLSINKYYITKMASKTQQVDHTKVRDMNQVS